MIIDKDIVHQNGEDFAMRAFFPFEEEALPLLLVVAGFKLVSWNHALRAGDFAATLARAGVSRWKLTEVHNLFWRAVF